MAYENHKYKEEASVKASTIERDCGERIRHPLGELTFWAVSRGANRGQPASFRQNAPETRGSPRFAESCILKEFTVNCFF
jgi:hypothetical protein